METANKAHMWAAGAQARSDLLAHGQRKMRTSADRMRDEARVMFRRQVGSSWQPDVTPADVPPSRSRLS